MGHRSKRADELLSALAGEFDLLRAENAALARELESLHLQLNDVPVSCTPTTASASRQNSVLPIRSVRHLGPTADSTRGQEELPADPPVTPSLTLTTAATAPSLTLTTAANAPTMVPTATLGGASPKQLTASPKRRAAHTPPPRFDRMENVALTFMHTNSELLVEEVYENFYDLSRAFHTLCAKHKITVSAREICEMDQYQQGESPKLVDHEQEALFSQAILELNKDLRLATKTKKPSQEVMLETYSIIVSGHKAESKLERAGKSVEVIEAVTKMRDILLKEDAIRKIAHATNTGWEDIYVSDKALIDNRTENCLRYMDPFIGFVILCNAVVIGISADFYVGSPVWDWCEGCFTVIFFIEVIVKVRAHGFVKHFLGHDNVWNLFDFLVVLIAVTDLIVTLLGGLLMLGNVTLVRLLRFARLTKLVRVLKLKVFKELALLVNGCFAGFRTLVWAMVFLAFILFVLGVLVKGYLGETDPVYYPMCPNATLFPEEADCAEYSEDCLRSAAKLDQYRLEMFGSVPRSMFTMLRCFTDGCNYPDGTPVVPAVYNTHGLPTVLLYQLCMVFVTFGLFNLIVAVFVENTIENAKHDEERRREARTHEHIRVARKLQEVILMFCAGEQDILSETRFGPADEQATGVFGWFKRVFSTRWTLKEGLLLRDQLFDEQIKFTTSNLSLKVTRGSFHKILERPEVKQLLDDLEIGYSSRGALFDVLDANCNGVLEVSELVQGLLKLRGAAEKGDIIASLLAIRSLQRNMKAIELLGLKHQNSIDSLHTAHERVESHVRRISRATNAAQSGPLHEELG